MTGRVRNRRSWFLAPLAVALCTAAVLATSTAAQEDGAAGGTAPATEEIDLLFTQTADHGTLKAVGDHHLLTLRGVSRIVWFQTSPGTYTGDEATRVFVRNWKSFGFADLPPNAALSIRVPGKERRTVVLELGDPRYEHGKRRLRFRAETLQTTQADVLKSRLKFGGATLTIDDATAEVIDGCVIQPMSQCSYADLQNADLAGVDLDHAVLVHANLESANLEGADLTAVIGYDSNMIQANLRDTKLGSSNFNSTNFSDSDMTGAIVGSAYLSGAVFLRATVVGTGFGSTNLTNTNWAGADLTSANLSKTELDFANFSGATTTRTIFTGARFHQTVCSDGSTVTSPSSC